MKINERIDFLIKHLNLNKNSFSKELGLKNNSTIGQIVSGRNNPGFDILLKIAEVFPHINVRWILTGEGEMIKGEMEQSIASEPAPEYGIEFLVKENQFLKEQILNKDQEIERLWNLFEKGSKKAV